MLNSSNPRILVIGAGLAGSEASYFLAENGFQVVLIESKRVESNPAQKSVNFAELVCTNSLKSIREDSAHGLLKMEMKALGSLVLKVASETSVPAGDALAVDRDKFAQGITKVLSSHSKITIVDEIVSDPWEAKKKYNCEYAIVASGPLTCKPLEEWIQKNISGDDFYFYDAIAPIVDADSLDYSKLYFKDRHKEVDESADYLNAPMDKEQYYTFIEELVKAEKVPAQKFEDYQFFESCLPVDIMAERGKDTARFSCMKPIGLEFEDGKMPFAVVQLRKENLLGSAFNLVGFQNRLRYPEQVRVFKMIPGFENASFISLGSVHRNSFLNARKLLNHDLSSKKDDKLYFAGQITGVEGYTESASMGLYVAWNIMRKIQGKEFKLWPKETAIGALVHYIMTIVKPTPSNINFGLLPTIELTKEQRRNKDRKKIKKALVAKRANEIFEAFMSSEKNS